MMLSIAACALALLGDDPKVARVEAQCRELMQRFRVPGISVALITNGEIAWAHGYGVKKEGEPDPVTPRTLFQAASISKPVAATAALRLVRLGELELDEDVNDTLLSWHVPENELTTIEKVTLRRLLCHGAGLTVHGFPGYESGPDWPLLLQVLDGASPANSPPIRVDLKPGTRFRYSGGGYCVMQQLLVDVTGKRFPDLMRETVLEPIGMVDSTYEQPLPDSLLGNAATGHERSVTSLNKVRNIYPEQAAAGLWTTASDLARFLIEIKNAAAGRSERVLSTELAQQMLSPQVEAHIGLGLFLEGDGPSARFSHGGSNRGFRCQAVACRATGQGAVVMTNADGGDSLLPELIKVLEREYAWPPLPKK